MTPTKTKFFFKKRKEKNEAGLVVKEIPAPEPLEIELPLLSMDDVVALINGEGQDDDTKAKVRGLILEALNNVIIEQARDAVNDDTEGVREKGIPADSVDFTKIALMPPAQRRGSAIPDEVWEAFIADYTEVMQHHGKTKEKAEMGAKLLSKKFQAVKGNKKVIAALKDNLSTWFANSEKAEEFQQVYETLATKADTLLAADEEALLAAV
jgi:hypothetical protein